MLPDAFERAFVERIQRAYSQYVLAQRSGEGRAVEVGDRRFMIPVELRAPFDDPGLYANPLVLAILRAVLGEDCVLNSFSSVVALPGAEAQARHKDHDLLFGFDPGARLPCHALTLVIPLADLDETSGTTALWERSHRVELGGGADAEPVEPWLSMGECLLMDYRLSHAGTPNRGDKLRPILYVVYSRPWFLDERNFYSLPALRLGGDPTLAPALRPLFARARLPGVRLL